MTTPTPTDSDKRAAQEIACYLDPEWQRGESLESKRAEIAKFIAAAMQPEREQLRLAKKALRSIAATYLPSSDDAPDFTLSDMVEKVEDCREQAKSALTEIEKVLP